jgi:hypothetical protein
MYALASFLAVLALWAARQIWERGRWSDWLLYVLSMTTGLYTLYLFFPILIAANVAWLLQWRWEWRRSRGATLVGEYSATTQDQARQGEFAPRHPVTSSPSHPVNWLLAQAAVVGLFLPWLLYAAGGFLSTSSALPITLRDFLAIYWTVLTVGIPLDVNNYTPLTLPVFVIFLAGLAVLIAAMRRQAGKARYRRARDLTLLLTVLLLPVAIVYVLSLPKQDVYAPPFSPRYLVIFTSFYSILLSWGLVTFAHMIAGRLSRESRGAALVGEYSPTTLEQRSGGARKNLPISQSPNLQSPISGLFSTVGWGAAALLAGVIVYASLVGLRTYHPGRVLIDDYKSLVDTIEAYKQPGDVVVLYTDTDWPIFAYHYPESWRGVPHLWTMTPEMAGSFLTPLWNTHQGLWLVTTPYSAIADPQRHVPLWLEERAEAARGFLFKDMALHFYARTPERAETAGVLASVQPFHTLEVDIGNDVRLAGYQQAAHDFKSGDTIHLFLYTQGNQETAVEVGLMDEQDQMWATSPITLQSAPDLARQQVDLPVPPEARTGEYRFYVRDTQGNVTRFGRAHISQKQTPLLTAGDVKITNRLDVSFDDGITLLGYDLATSTLRPGETVNLTLYWQAAGPLAQRYKVFTHLLGETFNAANGNFLWGQLDSEPAANTRLTTTWRTGEVIVDEYAIRLQADAPAGPYRIEIGLYDPISGARLSLLDENGTPAADHLILTSISVESN